MLERQPAISLRRRRQQRHFYVDVFVPDAPTDAPNSSLQGSTAAVADWNFFFVCLPLTLPNPPPHSEYTRITRQTNGRVFFWGGQGSSSSALSLSSLPLIPHLIPYPLPFKLPPANEPFPVFFRLIYGRAAGGAEEEEKRKRSKVRRSERGRKAFKSSAQKREHARHLAGFISKLATVGAHLPALLLGNEGGWICLRDPD